jgi:hypothetical protein
MAEASLLCSVGHYLSMGRTLEKPGPALSSPECVEVEFSELRLDRVLGSSRRLLIWGMRHPL